MPKAGFEQSAADRLNRAMLVCAVMVVLLAGLPLLTPVLPQLHFDMDPRGELAGGPAAAIGPVGVVALAIVSSIVAAVTLAGHRRLGGRVGWGSLILASLGTAVALWHGMDHITDALFAAQCLWAVSLALAGYHLAQHDRYRGLMLAGLLGIAVAMALRAGYYLWVEHPQTVAHFHRHEFEFLKARGWTQGSAQHLSYLRRLEHAEAAGALSLSNVFGSLMAGLLTASWTALLGVKLLRQTGQSHAQGWQRIAAGAVLTLTASAFALWASSSRGAMAAAVMVLAAVTAFMVIHRLLARRGQSKSPHGRRIASLAVVAVLVMVAMPNLAVWLVGQRQHVPAVDDPLLSIYFRNQYASGAKAIFDDADWDRRLLGTGPADFATQYLAHRPKNAPEEVTSTHHVFLDWLIMLGAGGAAWLLLMLTWLITSTWHATGSWVSRLKAEGHEHISASEAHPAPSHGQATPSKPPIVSSEKRMAQSKPQGASSKPASRKAGSQQAGTQQAGTQQAGTQQADIQRSADVSEIAWPVVWIVAGVMLVELLVRRAIVLGLEQQLLIWALGGIGWIAAGNLLLWPALDRTATRRWQTMALLAAAVTLLVHSQIEMTFFHLGSAAPAWLIVALAAGAVRPCNCVATQVAGSDKTTAQASRPGSVTSSVGIKPPGGWFACVLAGAIPLILAGVLLASSGVELMRYHRTLARAADALSQGQTDPARALLRRARDGKLKAMVPYRWLVTLDLEAAQHAASRSRPDQARRAFTSALAHLEHAAKRGIAEPALWRLQAQTEQLAGQILGRQAWMSRAVSSWYQVLQANPRSVTDHLRAADLLWQMGRRQQAAGLYKQVIELNASMALDPLRQLSAEDLVRAQKRVPPSAEASTPGAAESGP